MEIQKILVPLDGSKLAEQALTHANVIARRYKATLILLRVIPMQPYAMMSDPSLAMDGGVGPTMIDYDLVEDMMDSSRKDANEYLQKQRQLLADDGILCRIMTEEGDEAGTVVDTAVSEKADLIIMTTHGRSGFSRWMMGSVAERVLRESTCPVMVSRITKPVRKLLISLDGSELSEKALPVGFAIADAQKTEVHLLRAQESNVHFGARALDLAGKRLSDNLEEAELAAYRAYLEKAADPYRALGLNLVTAVAHTPPAEAVLEYSEAHEIDLIVMATHGRTGLRRWVYGSVTEKVLRSADRNLLVVRPPA